LSDPSGLTSAGRSYVIFGKTGTGAVDLAALHSGGPGGFVIDGQCASDRSGLSVSSAGDVNGDGFADLLVGAHEADPNGRTLAGRAYVIFGGEQTGSFVEFLGSGGDDVLNGPSATTVNLSETFAGGAGADTIYGGGGADVMYGGAGNDVFVLNADNVAQLMAGPSALQQLARVDGGGGIDTLQLQGAGVVLDMTLISAVGASTPGSLSRLESIEKIDLTGSGNNTLRIAAADVLDLSGFNTFDVNGSPAVVDALHQLLVSGNAGDTLHLTDPGWAQTGTYTEAGATYAVWTDEQQRAQLLVSANVSVIGG
jgi:Ca2+-binding RTX toxin-like protein